MSERDVNALIALAVVISFAIGIGYLLGKRKIIRLLRIHQGCGRTLKAALDYEEAVIENRVPSDAGSEEK